MDKENSTDEIEITPEMIEAGLDEFVAYDDRFHFEEDAVRRIFRAMIKKAHQSISSQD
jgi:hypothetical protein